jgi:hypothetical protein
MRFTKSLMTPNSSALFSLNHPSRSFKNARGYNYITTDSEDNNTLKVFTSTGQLVFETQISRIESMMEIDLSSFPPGLYICTVSGENTPTRIGKLIIHH